MKLITFESLKTHSCWSAISGWFVQINLHHRIIHFQPSSCFKRFQSTNLFEAMFIVFWCVSRGVRTEWKSKGYKMKLGATISAYYYFVAYWSLWVASTGSFKISKFIFGTFLLLSILNKKWRGKTDQISTKYREIISCDLCLCDLVCTVRPLSHVSIGYKWRIDFQLMNNQLMDNWRLFLSQNKKRVHCN